MDYNTLEVTRQLLSNDGICDVSLSQIFISCSLLDFDQPKFYKYNYYVKIMDIRNNEINLK